MARQRPSEASDARPRPATLAGRWRAIPQDVRVLAAFQLIIGVGIALFALFPPLEATPRAAEAAGAVGALVLCVATLLMPTLPSTPPWAMALSVCLTGILLAGLTAVLPTPQGQVLAALGLVMLGLFSAQHLRAPSLVVTLAIMLGCYVLALFVNHQIPGVLVYAAAVCLVTVGVTVQVARLVGRLQYQATHDPLTGALNRNGLTEFAPAVRDLAARAQQPTSVALIDIDGFKAFNDEHGHLAGDDVLAALVDAWRSQLRSSDLVGRFGGDEFALVLPGSTKQEVPCLLERLRGESALGWTAGSVVWAPEEDLFAALGRADNSLYRAKRARVDHVADDV